MGLTAVFLGVGAQGCAMSASSPPVDPALTKPQLLNGPEVADFMGDHYPSHFREQGIGGTANLWMFVTPEGRVEEVRVARSTGNQLLDRIAVQAAMRMRFAPAEKEGEIIASWVTFPLTFDPNR